MDNQACIQDDEIDLVELFKTLWNGKKTILIVTFTFLILAVIYTSLATKWYKAEALVEIGYYKQGVEEVQLATTPEVVEGLSFVYIEVPKHIPNRDSYIESISEVKDKPKFFKIVSYGKDNELAKSHIKRVVDDTAKAHKNTLDGYLSSQKVALANLDRQIDFLKNNKIVSVKQQIDNVKNLTLPRMQRQIDYLEKNTIPLAKIDIKNIDDISMVTIDEKIKLLEANIIRYEKDLENLRKSINEAGVDTLAFLYMQEQNLNSQIASNRENIITLEQQKDLLVTKTKPELQARLDKLMSVDFMDMHSEIDKVVQDTLPALERELYSLQTSELNKLLDERSILELSLKPHNYKNTSIVGDIAISESPDKPKKLLIWAVSCLLGFFIAVFGVLVYDMVKKYKK